MIPLADDERILLHTGSRLYDAGWYWKDRHGNLHGPVASEDDAWAHLRAELATLTLPAGASRRP